MTQAEENQQAQAVITDLDSGQPSLRRAFTLKQRLALWAITTFATLAIRLLGSTLRVTQSAEDGLPFDQLRTPGIYCFWHQCAFAAAYMYRNQDISVMTSRSFDGEFISRTIQKLGFRPVRGSSSRGGARALLEMHREIESGHKVVFTADGPRGPKHVAKPGPVLLAKNTQAPLVCFHVALSHAWTLKSWDATMIPKPFSRVHLFCSGAMSVPSQADSATMERLHGELQATLERVTATANQLVSR